MARFRPLTTEIAAPTTSGTASSVSAANVVRAYHAGGGSGAVLVTLTSAAGATIGSFSIAAGDVVFIDKDKTQKIFASASDVKLTSVTYPI